MDIVHALIWLIIICGFVAIGLWAIRAMGITIPQPIVVVIVVVVAVVCLLFLAGLMGGGGMGGLNLGLHSRC